MFDHDSGLDNVSKICLTYSLDKPSMLSRDAFVESRR